MDSRHKIIDPIFVSGYFDPLLAAHVRRLRELAANGNPLIVLLADPPDPLLPSRSRAELVAALDCVHAVILPNPDGAAREVPGAIREQEADLLRRDELIADVHRRHAAV
jgi:glycerol-3-phosphate cytidylyltransferase-like family protein